jgi:hypothetical protein
LAAAMMISQWVSDGEHTMTASTSGDAMIGFQSWMATGMPKSAAHASAALTK